MAQSTRATGATANIIVITERTEIDLAMAQGDDVDALSFTISPNYS